MLSPKRTKYRKQHKGRIHGNAKGGTALNFGSIGLKAMEPGRVTARHVPVTQKPAEVRMGKGKGSVEFWACRVKPGRVMFEMDGVAPELATVAFELAAAKMPIKCKIVTRIGG